MKFFRFPIIARWILRKALYNTGRPGKTVCLSFDDGPDPETTPIILEILERYNIKALFFLSGRNAEKHPSLAKQIREKGHIAGNHGYNHLKGTKTKFKEYIDDIHLAAESTSTTIFRPPYGKITPRQYRYLTKHFTIVLWDLMAYDFDQNFDKGKVLNLILRKCRNGSVIVLHDKPGASSTEILEEVIINLIDKGYCFVLPEGI